MLNYIYQVSSSMDFSPSLEGETYTIISESPVMGELRFYFNKGE